MAKEKKEVVVEETVVETKPVKKEKKVEQPKWETKDRTYYLKGTKSPLTLTIPAKHTRKHALLWFDTEKIKLSDLNANKTHFPPLFHCMGYLPKLDLPGLTWVGPLPWQATVSALC